MPIGKDEDFVGVGFGSVLIAIAGDCKVRNNFFGIFLGNGIKRSVRKTAGGAQVEKEMLGHNDVSCTSGYIRRRVPQPISASCRRRQDQGA